MDFWHSSRSRKWDELVGEREEEGSGKRQRELYRRWACGSTRAFCLKAWPFVAGVQTLPYRALENQSPASGLVAAGRQYLVPFESDTIAVQVGTASRMFAVQYLSCWRHLNTCCRAGWKVVTALVIPVLEAGKGVPE